MLKGRRGNLEEIIPLIVFVLFAGVALFIFFSVNNQRQEGRTIDISENIKGAGAEYDLLLFLSTPIDGKSASEHLIERYYGTNDLSAVHPVLVSSLKNHPYGWIIEVSEQDRLIYSIDRRGVVERRILTTASKEEYASALLPLPNGGVLEVKLFLLDKREVRK